MSFVKLDCGFLDSTLWMDREAREIFITALLMAKPVDLKEGREQLEVRSLNRTGFEVPPGKYGFVEAAGPGIVRRAGMEMEDGLLALERLGNPEVESRTPDFGGRRLVRVDGGYIALNYTKYREKDHTAAQRMKKYRDGQKRKSKRTLMMVRAEHESRERRFVEADGKGEVEKADAIAAEGKASGLVGD